MGMDNPLTGDLISNQSEKGHDFGEHKRTRTVSNTQISGKSWPRQDQFCHLASIYDHHLFELTFPNFQITVQNSKFIKYDKNKENPR